MANIYPPPEETPESEPEPKDATIITGSPFTSAEPEQPGEQAAEEEQAAATAIFSRDEVSPDTVEEALLVEESPSMEEVSTAEVESFPAPSVGEPIPETLAETIPPADETAYSTPAVAADEGEMIVPGAPGGVSEVPEDIPAATVVSGWSPEPELNPISGEQPETSSPDLSEPAAEPAGTEPTAWEASPGTVPPPAEPAAEGYSASPPSPGRRSSPPQPPTPLSGEEERTWAALAHLSVLLNTFTGLLGPVAALIIYLAYKDRSRYVAYHAYQSMLFQLIWWVGGGALAGIAWTISGALVAVFLIGCLLMPFALLISLIPLAALVYGVIGAIQVGQGKDFKYWLVGDWARDILTG